jgi:hypothetical protein
VADQEINLCAFMVELMMNCGFKEWSLLTF